jgi:tetratricopeptide (TPR) repeat protein
VSERRARQLLLGLLVVLLAAGCALRLWSLATLEADDPLYASPSLDALYHQHVAAGWATGDWSLPRDSPDPRVMSTPLHRPAGTPLALSFIRRLTDSPFAPRLAQSILGLLLGLLVFAVSRRAFPRAPPLAAVAAAGGAWLSPSLIYFEGELQAVTWGAVLLTSLVLVLLRWLEKPNLRRAALFGAVLGVLVLFRPNAAPLGLLALLPALRVWREHRVRAALLVVVAAVVTLAINAPVAFRNHTVSGEWVLTSTNGGMSLAFANHADADGVENVAPPTPLFRGVDAVSPLGYERLKVVVERNAGQKLSYKALDARLAAEARAWIGSDPAGFLGLTARRALMLLGPAEIANNRPVDVILTKRTPLRLAPARFWLLLAFAAVGAAFAWRRRDDTGALPGRAVVLAFAIYLAPLVFFFAGARLRAPLIPLVAVLAGLGLVEVSRLARERRADWPAIAAAAVGALLAVPWASPEPRVDRYHLERALAHQRLGDLEAAAAALDLAERASANEGAAITRGYLELKRERPAEAEAAFRRALAARETASGLAGLGAALASLGRAQDAIAPLERALTLDPGEVNAWYNLGLARFQAGKPAEARGAYERALALDPDHRGAKNNLARTLLATGDSDRALSLLNELVAAAPDDRDARFNLGRALEATGQTTAAAGAYRTVLRAHPDDVDALTNLGVLLERTDPEGALAHLARAAARSSHPGVQGNHARALAAVGRRAEARAVLEAALQRTPTPALTDQLARLLVVDEPERALALAQSLVDQSKGTHPRPLLTLARALRALGRSAEAASVADRARELCGRDERLKRYCDEG